MAERTSSPIHANPETFGREAGRWAGFREEGVGRFSKSHLNKIFLDNECAEYASLPARRLPRKGSDLRHLPAPGVRQIRWRGKPQESHWL